MEQIYIIKIGGNVIDNDAQLQVFLDDFVKIKSKKILVHGGGKLATELSKKLGTETKMVYGRRITDAETLKIATMVYGGFINKNMVAKLQSLGCNSIGLTGADANILPAKKRAVKEVDFGFVGDIETENLDATRLQLFLDAGLTPVIAPLTHDTKGNLLNTNADSIASSIAVMLSKNYKVSLIYCFEKNGILKNIADENSVIPEITSANLQPFKDDGIITDGMIPKVDNAFDALKKGVSSVYITHAKNIVELQVNKEPTGTKIHDNNF